MPSTAPIRRTDTADVVIIGAGLAGLAAAHHLSNAGVAVTVLEAADRIGGRLATDRTDGYLLDHGAQLFCQDWPELARCHGLESLALRPFSPGAVVRSGDRSIRVSSARTLRPSGVTGGARHTARALAHAVDAARLRGQLARLGSTPVARLHTRAELPAERALGARGVPGRTVEALLRPLVAALLGDPDLTTSSRVVDLALRGFA
ncbi:FAD-dependent oxidoreductase, partial [Streptomyces sparsus]